MSELRAFPKPHELEGIVTLTEAEKREKRKELFREQRGRCACGCGRSMTMDLDVMATATIDHYTPNKMGCRKQDAEFNLRLIRWDCNSEKGSKRIL